MVKFHTSSHTYEHPLATVSLAYFLRYPNPFSPHVLSTDVLERSFDPTTGQVATTRLVLKRSRMPKAILALLPRGFLRANAQGEGQTFVLERSVVDARGGWMRTESRNLELRTVLDVIERQTYIRTTKGAPQPVIDPYGPILEPVTRSTAASEAAEVTDVRTVVTLHSRLGQKLRQKADDAQRSNFLISWSQERLRRSIEAIGLSRTSKSQPNAMEGMKVVMERLRQEGLVSVLEGMRREREAGRAFA
jgi:4-amino-4-deoxychorismate lyase